MLKFLMFICIGICMNLRLIVKLFESVSSSCEELK